MGGYAIEEGTVIGLPRPGGTVEDDPLLCVLREGARQMLTHAIEAEVAAFLAVHAATVDEGRRRRLVRHGHAPKRVISDRDRRDRGPTASGARPWCRRRVPHPLHLGGAARLPAPGQEHRRAPGSTSRACRRASSRTGRTNRPSPAASGCPHPRRLLSFPHEHAVRRRSL